MTPSMGREMMQAARAASALFVRPRGSTFAQTRSSRQASAGTIVSTVEKREVAAEKNRELKDDDEDSRDRARDPRPENKPGRDQLRQVIENASRRAGRLAAENETSGSSHSGSAASRSDNRSRSDRASIRRRGS